MHMHHTCIVLFLEFILHLGINIEDKKFKGACVAETQVLMSEKDLGK